MTNCRMDGGQERFTGCKEQPRPLATQVSLDTLPAKLPPDNLYEPEVPPQQPGEVPTLKQNTLCGQVLTAFPQYRRLNRLRRDRPSLNLSAHCSQRDELCDGCWRSAHVEDAWHVQARAMIHVCGPSCWKCNKNGARVCRHNCYHIVELEPDDACAEPADKPMKLRRDGRPLNNQLFIQEESSKGKRGRVIPIIVMPMETMTNYGVACSLRCNFDGQSL